MRVQSSRVVHADEDPLLLPAIYSIGSPQRQALPYVVHQEPITLLVPGRGSPAPASITSSIRMTWAAPPAAQSPIGCTG